MMKPLSLVRQPLSTQLTRVSLLVAVDLSRPPLAESSSVWIVTTGWTTLSCFYVHDSLISTDLHDLAALITHITYP